MSTPSGGSAPLRAIQTAFGQTGLNLAKRLGCAGVAALGAYWVYDSYTSRRTLINEQLDNNNQDALLEKMSTTYADESGAPFFTRINNHFRNVRLDFDNFMRGIGIQAKGLFDTVVDNFIPITATVIAIGTGFGDGIKKLIGMIPNTPIPWDKIGGFFKEIGKPLVNGTNNFILKPTFGFLKNLPPAGKLAAAFLAFFAVTRTMDVQSGARQQEFFGDDFNSI